MIRSEYAANVAMSTPAAVARSTWTTPAPVRAIAVRRSFIARLLGL